MSETKVPQVTAVATVLLTLTWTFAILRCYVRVKISKYWGWDDTLLIASQVFLSLEIGMVLAASRYGLGSHLKDIPSSSLHYSLLFWWIFELFYTLATTLLRCSVAIFTLRICKNRNHKKIVFCIMGPVLLFSIFYLSLLIFRCNPPSYFWTQYDPGSRGSCLSAVLAVANSSYAHCAVSATADWMLGIMPVWLVWDLKMNMRTKISVVALLSFGMVAGIAAVIRIPYIHQLVAGDDFFWDSVEVLIWSIIEPSLCIIATAACVLRPLLKKFYGLSSSSGNTADEARTRPPAWRSTRARDGVSAVQRETELTKTAKVSIELSAVDGVASSVLGKYKGERARSWLENNASISQVRGGFESEEELIKEKGGILVQRTVDVHSREGKQGQAEQSTHTTDLEQQNEYCFKVYLAFYEIISLCGIGNKIGGMIFND